MYSLPFLAGSRSAGLDRPSRSVPDPSERASIRIFDGGFIADDARSDLSLRLRLHLDRLFVLAVIAVIGI
jgi:hypothetical protein